MRIHALLALSIATAASAQTNTTCFVNGQWINCTTQQRGPVDTRPTDFLSGLGPLPGSQPQDPEVHRRAVLAKLSELIQGHQCDDAKALAIREGGLQAGLQVAQLCK